MPLDAEHEALLRAYEEVDGRDGDGDGPGAGDLRVLARAASVVFGENDTDQRQEFACAVGHKGVLINMLNAAARALPDGDARVDELAGAVVRLLFRTEARDLCTIRRLAADLSSYHATVPRPATPEAGALPTGPSGPRGCSNPIDQL